jgi:5-methyltetrahydropteroyltriglutamate--homocysteine methyltransferase
LRRSTDKILTTHAGSLPDPEGLGRHDAGAGVRGPVEDIVRQQREIGLDIINEGEWTKGGDWLAYVEERFSGFEQRPPKGLPVLLQGKDREEFADFYRYASERGTLFYEPGGQI